MPSSSMASLILGFFCLTMLTGSWGSLLSRDNNTQKKLHIVYLGALPQTSTHNSIVESHIELLSTVQRSKAATQEAYVVSYTKSFNGFAAKLSQREAQALKEKDTVISVFPSRKMQPLTTRSWDYIGLTSSSPRNPAVESDIIVGIVDTGIWPENPMFNDTGIGPVPTRWKGKCTSGDQFTAKNCNRKIIGAKYFAKGYEANNGPLTSSTDYISPRDKDGHGSHTASTAAGSIAEGVSLYGLANGTARGAVPAARIAVYKVCWSGGCDEADLLSAIDEAVYDGVDLLSLSLGSSWPVDYIDDGIAIGCFHAMEKGILASCAAGNSAPLFPVSNTAPWVITVAASSIDRQFYSPILLGNNVTIKGTGINTFMMNDSWYPLITGSQGLYANSTDDLNYCDSGSLDENKVKGKIVYCEAGGSGNIDADVLEAKGAGLIFSAEGSQTVGFSFVLPATVIGDSDSQKVLEYINNTKDPVAKILPCDVSMHEPAPFLGYFSSRGPNYNSRSIMKPDLAAPGIDILAAWSMNDSVTEQNAYDTRYPLFNIISGTSMATPHVTGAAAYVKSLHPDWSPAAIKSALMTTATPMDPSNPLNQDREFGYGAGNLNPTSAGDPGLVYDASYGDYVLFLCSHGLNTTTVRALTGDATTDCPDDPAELYSLNYPAITAAYPIDLKGEWYRTKRTLTNVGGPAIVDCTYEAMVDAQGGLMEVQVSPSRLAFSSYGQQLSFQVSLRAPGLGSSSGMLSGALSWVCTAHPRYSVRAPIVAYLLSL